MKKIIGLLSSVSMAIAPAMSVVACNEDDFYNDTFLPEINNKDNAVIYIGADNCPYCETFYNDIWSNFFDTPEMAAESYGEVYNDDSSVYSWPQTGKEDYEHVDFIRYQLEDESTAYDDDSVTAITDWILDWYKDANAKDDYINVQLSKDDIGLVGMPLFIFIHDGQFSGFKSGAPGNIKSFWTEFFNYLVYGNIDIDPIPEPDDPDA